MNIQKTTLAQIAKEVPGATRIFRKYNLDFCCSGNRLLQEALPGNIFLQTEIYNQIQTLAEQEAHLKPDDLSNQELIDTIIERFHKRHKEDLSELILLASKVEKVHSLKKDCPKGLADHLAFMYSELTSHMEKEEEHLFPKINQGSETLQEVLKELDEEHNAHGENLSKLAEILNDFEIPEGACTTWRALILGSKELVDEIMEHVHWENNILFPRLQSQLMEAQV